MVRGLLNRGRLKIPMSNEQTKGACIRLSWPCARFKGRTAKALLETDTPIVDTVPPVDSTTGTCMEA